MKKINTYLIIFSILTLFFLYGYYIYPHSATLPSGLSLEVPNINHIFGTDNLGIDIYAQISSGFFRSMVIGIVTAMFATIIGGLLGILSGYMGGTIDHITLFLINIFLSVPQLPVMIVIGAFFGQSTLNIIFIIAAFSWAQIAKQLRAKVISIKNMEYVKLAESYGGSPLYIIMRHLSRELIPLLMINGLAVIGRTIIQESSLAYLGLSDPIAKSWGLMISKATAFSGIYFSEFWKWWLMPPILALILSVLTLRLLSRALEQYMLKENHNEMSDSLRRE